MDRFPGAVLKKSKLEIRSEAWQALKFVNALTKLLTDFRKWGLSAAQTPWLWHALALFVPQKCQVV